jgi:hypothetical protein
MNFLEFSMLITYVCLVGTYIGIIYLLKELREE